MLRFLCAALAGNKGTINWWLEGCLSNKDKFLEKSIDGSGGIKYNCAPLLERVTKEGGSERWEKS